MNRRDFVKTTALASLAGDWLFREAENQKTHYITLSFDDGFKKSFFRIAEIYENYGLKGCFNVIVLKQSGP